jgi:hypothetical protein
MKEIFGDDLTYFYLPFNPKFTKRYTILAD